MVPEYPTIPSCVAVMVVVKGQFRWALCVQAVLLPVALLILFFGISLSEWCVHRRLHGIIPRVHTLLEAIIILIIPSIDVPRYSSFCARYDRYARWLVTVMAFPERVPSVCFSDCAQFTISSLHYWCIHRSGWPSVILTMSSLFSIESSNQFFTILFLQSLGNATSCKLHTFIPQDLILIIGPQIYVSTLKPLPIRFSVETCRSHRHV